MARHLLWAALAFLLGCGRGVPPLPELPAFQTRDGAECAKHCQKLHSWCIAGCVKGENERARKICFSQCGEKLGDCYELCETEDRL